MSLLSKLQKLAYRSAEVPAVSPEKRASQSVGELWPVKTSSTVVIYPPFDPGLPAVAVDEILNGAKVKIQRLAEVAGGSASEFDRLYLAPLRNLASQIHLLPASPHSHYSAPGGLFNMCLDVALLARQAAEGKIFVPEATIEVRHKTEPAWRYSAFLAGLLSQLHVPVGSMSVTSSTGDLWPRYGSSIADWLAKNNYQKYFVVWHERARVTGAEGASLLNTVVPTDVMDWLAATDSQIIRDINVAVTREMTATENILGAILKAVCARVKEVDALQQPSRFGRLTIGTQFEPHLLNAIRELIETRDWKINEPGGVVFWGSDGLYLAWPKALPDVLKIFEKRGLTAMPRSSVTLAELLGLSGVVIGKDTGVWVHDIVVPAQSGDVETVSAMRFKEPMVLLGHLLLKPLTQPFGKVLVDAHAEQLALAADSRKEPAPTKAEPASSMTAPEAHGEHTTSKQIPGRADQAPSGKTLSKVTAIVDHLVEVLPGDKLPPEILTRLRIKSTDDAAIALGMALEQSLQYRGDRVKVLDWGVAICCRWISEVAGYNVADLATPLNRISALAKSPDSRSLALVSNVVFSDSPEARVALVLKTEFAAKVGMPIDAKV